MVFIIVFFFFFLSYRLYPLMYVVYLVNDLICTDPFSTFKLLYISRVGGLLIASGTLSSIG